MKEDFIFVGEGDGGIREDVGGRGGGRGAEGVGARWVVKGDGTGGEAWGHEEGLVVNSLVFVFFFFFVQNVRRGSPNFGDIDCLPFVPPFVSFHKAMNVPSFQGQISFLLSRSGGDIVQRSRGVTLEKEDKKGKNEEK